jgi:gas vesicle protein
MEDDKRFSYFLLGLGIGAALGVLFAPKAGAETRGLIKEKADEGKEFLKRKSAALCDTAAEAVDRGKHAVARQKEQISAAVEAGKHAYREAVAPGGARAAEAHDALNEGV